MATLRLNITANYIGKMWLAFVSLAFVPLYIRFLGMESYGLIGIYLSLQSLFGLLDLGLSTTLNRELARLSVGEGKAQAQEMRDLVHTLQIIYWGVAIAIGAVVLILAPLISHHWVKAQHLSPNIINQTIIIMGLSIALQWPYALYYGGLIGLQRQVLLNGIVVSLATLRALGAVYILWKVSSTIQAFFYWQMFISTIQTVAAGAVLWRQLPTTDHAVRFRKQALSRIWRFAGGLTGISIVSLALIQLDKVVLSKILPLREFGNYTLAGTVAGGLSFFIAPVFDGIFPRFSQLATLQDVKALSDLYHRSCQMVATIILPMALVICLFSYQLLFIWTGNSLIAANTHWILSFLIMGSAFNSIMNLPYALQLAYGWTRLAFFSNLIASIILIPVIIVLAYEYGAIGGAMVWLALNCGYILISIQIMHTRLLTADKWRWYRDDFGLPLLAAGATAGLLKVLIPMGTTRFENSLGLFVVSSVTLVMTVIVMPFPRRLAIQYLQKIRTQTLWL